MFQDWRWATVLTSHINTATGSVRIEVAVEIIIVVLVYFHAGGVVYIHVTHGHRYPRTYVPVSTTKRYIHLALGVIVYVIVLVVYIPHRAGMVINNTTLDRRMVVVMDDAHLVAAVVVVTVHMLIVMMMLTMMMATTITLSIYAYAGTG
jgi:hypothetical protein